MSSFIQQIKPQSTFCKNKCRKITSLCWPSTHSDNVEFSYQSTLKVWVKGGKFFHFVPSCPLIFILHPLSNSDTSTFPTHAMPNWFELHKFASHICFLDHLLPCVMASPFISFTDFPGSCTCLLQAIVGSLEGFYLNHISIYFLMFCLFHFMVLQVPFSTMENIKLVIHITTKCYTCFYRVSTSQLLSS